MTLTRWDGSFGGLLRLGILEAQRVQHADGRLSTLVVSAMIHHGLRIDTRREAVVPQAKVIPVA